MIAVVLALLGVALVVALVLRVNAARRRTGELADLAPPPSELRARWLEEQRRRAEAESRRGGQPDDAPGGGDLAGDGHGGRPPGAPGSADPPAATAGAGPPGPGPTSLVDLLDGVRFPDDLLPLTHGMTPVELDFRLVLVTRTPATDVRAHLDEELRHAGFEVWWTGDTSGAARRHDGALEIRLHPPVPAEAAEPPPAARPGRRAGKATVPRRPDFPSAPLEATVVELQSASVA